MTAETHTADENARISLPSNFANCTVTVEQISEMEVRIYKVKDKSDGEAPFYEELVSPLSDRDRDLFLALLDNPPPANEVFKRAAARYKKRQA